MAKALVVNGADFESNRVAVIQFEGAHTTAVSVSPKSIELESVGDTETLTCTLTPGGSVDPVIWTSSNTAVATVANGVVTAVGIGECTITATSGSYSDSCSVSVDIYLIGIRTVNTLTESLQSGNNAFTKMTCNTGTTATTHTRYMTMVAGSQTVPEDLLCAKMAKNVATSGYDYQLIQPNEFESGTMEKRIYDYMGYPMPMKLPTGCTKIKCIALNDKYGAYPLFYDSKTHAIASNEDVNGAQYYCAFRKKYTPNAADYTWVYESESEYDVPEGYDSVVVSWASDPEDATAVLPINLTAEQIAEFKVQCL